MLGFFEMLQLLLVGVAVDNVSGEGELIVSHSFTTIGDQISLQLVFVCDISSQVNLHTEQQVRERSGGAEAKIKRSRP